MRINSQENYDVVIAGAGIAAAFTALRLLDFGFRPLILACHLPLIRGAESIPLSILRWQNIIDIATLLNQARAVVNKGFEVDLGGGNAFFKPEPVFHVERISLARTALAFAVSQGAALIYCKKLPALNYEDDSITALFENHLNKFQFAVDATGRRAVWSRPVGRAGKDVAYLFSFSQNGKAVKGKILLSKDNWAYRIDLPDEITVGIVGNPKTQQNFLDYKKLRKLHLPKEEAKLVNRRPAFPQWALEACKNRCLFAVGDAAFAHNPIAGQGVLFALSSAVALSAVLRTCRDLPQNTDLAICYYRELINLEKRRHLSFLETFAANISENEKNPVTLPKLSPTTLLRFSAPTQISGVQRDGYILPEETILLRDGSFVRWLGGFDLLKLKILCSTPTSLSVLSKSLKNSKLSTHTIELLIQWCLTNRILEIS
jgi:flavin-dependent dehydrogenase